MSEESGQLFQIFHFHCCKLAACWELLCNSCTLPAGQIPPRCEKRMVCVLSLEVWGYSHLKSHSNIPVRGGQDGRVATSRAIKDPSQARRHVQLENSSLPAFEIWNCALRPPRNAGQCLPHCVFSLGSLIKYLPRSGAAFDVTNLNFSDFASFRWNGRAIKNNNFPCWFTPQNAVLKSLLMSWSQGFLATGTNIKKSKRGFIYRAPDPAEFWTTD